MTFRRWTPKQGDGVYCANGKWGRIVGPDKSGAWVRFADGHITFVGYDNLRRERYLEYMLGHYAMGRLPWSFVVVATGVSYVFAWAAAGVTIGAWSAAGFVATAVVLETVRYVKQW